MLKCVRLAMVFKKLIVINIKLWCITNISIVIEILLSCIPYYLCHDHSFAGESYLFLT